MALMAVAYGINGLNFMEIFYLFYLFDCCVWQATKSIGLFVFGQFSNKQTTSEIELASGLLLLSFFFMGYFMVHFTPLNIKFDFW